MGQRQVCRKHARVGSTWSNVFIPTYIDVLGFPIVAIYSVPSEDRVGCLGGQGQENFGRGTLQWKLRSGLFVRKRHATILRVAMRLDVCGRRSIAEILLKSVFSSFFPGPVRGFCYRGNFDTSLSCTDAPICSCIWHFLQFFLSIRQCSVPVRRFDRPVLLLSSDWCEERSGEDGCLHSILERAAAAWESQVRAQGHQMGHEKPTVALLLHSAIVWDIILKEIPYLVDTWNAAGTVRTRQMYLGIVF